MESTDGKKPRRLNGWVRIWVVLSALSWLVGISTAQKMLDHKQALIQFFGSERFYWQSIAAEVGCYLVIGPAIVYLLGWVIAWVRRGFRQP
jgi:hypothetical protein